MRKYLSMVLTFVAVSTLPVAAATQQDLDWCSEKGNPTLDQQIESCTGVIESGVFSQQVLGLVFNNRAVALSQKGQYDRALEDYDRALRLAPTHVDAWIGRAFIFKQKGQYARAVQDYDQAIRLDPNRPTSFYDRGITFQLNGQHDRAIPDFNEAIRLDPKFPRAYSSRGNSYGLLRQSDRALQDFDQAIRFEPNYPYPYSNRAAIYKAQGERDRAIADWRKVLTLMPDESLRNRAEAELRELGGSGAADDATCFNTNATSTAGIAACGELIASGKGTMSDRAKAYHWRGRHLRNDREYDRAIADFDEAIRLNPQDAVLIERALTWEMKGNIDRALEDYTHAIQVNPRSTVAYNNRGVILLRKGEIAKAYADFTDALRLDATDAKIHTNRGRAYEMARQFDDAIGDHEEAIRLNPKLAIAYANRGLAYEGKGDRGRALAGFEQALAIDSKLDATACGQLAHRASCLVTLKTHRFCDVERRSTHPVPLFGWVDGERRCKFKMAARYTTFNRCMSPQSV